MDLRIEKTEKAIKNAFIELRAKKPLEKISVKELCAEACINKSTFYSHYADIYALSEAIERETVLSLIRILFSGKEQNHLANQLDRELKKVIFRKNPEYEKDVEKNIILSYCIQGAYHAYQNNPEADTETFVRTIEEIVKCLQPIL